MNSETMLLRRAGPAVVAATLATAALCLGAGDSTQAAQPARFVLLSGVVTWASDTGTGRDVPIILRMDTVTGKTWVYREVMSKGRALVFWTSVQEPSN